MSQGERVRDEVRKRTGTGHTGPCGLRKDLSFFYFLSEERAIEETLLWLCVWELQRVLAALHGGEGVCVG